MRLEREIRIVIVTMSSFFMTSFCEWLKIVTEMPFIHPSFVLWFDWWCYQLQSLQSATSVPAETSFSLFKPGRQQSACVRSTQMFILFGLIKRILLGLLRLMLFHHHPVKRAPCLLFGLRFTQLPCHRCVCVCHENRTTFNLSTNQGAWLLLHLSSGLQPIRSSAHVLFILFHRVCQSVFSFLRLPCFKFEWLIAPNQSGLEYLELSSSLALHFSCHLIFPNIFSCGQTRFR